VNTVSDLRRTLVEEARRLEPAPGLEARVLQQTFGRAGEEKGKRRTAQPGRLVEVPRLMALIAALLALVIVISLVFTLHALHLVGQVPSGVPVGQATVINPVAFRCSLPVTAQVYPSVAVQVQMPGGMVVNPSRQPATVNTPAIYDVQAKRWLPVPRSAVSLDGMTWAYGTGMLDGSGRNGTVHIVDAVTGKDRQVWSGAGGALVLGWYDGLYFLELGSGTAAIWKYVQNKAQRLESIPSLGNWDATSMFGALGGFTLIGDSHGTWVGVARMDSSGKVTTWFTSPAGPGQMRMLGLDDNKGLVLEDRQSRVLLLSGPETYEVISNGTEASFQPNNARGDSHGIWFGQEGAIWLYQAGTGLREIVTVPQDMFPQPSPKFPGIAATPPLLSVIGDCT
jgi:hypothetical protein